jgi:hypothetical protein
VIHARELLTHLNIRGLDRQPSPVRHRVAGVYDEIYYDLFDLTGVRSDDAEI